MLKNILIALTAICCGVILWNQTSMQRDIQYIDNDLHAIDSTVSTNITDMMGNYQIQVIQDSMIVWDGTRYVGTLPMVYDEDPVSTLLMEDIEGSL